MKILMLVITKSESRQAVKIRQSLLKNGSRMGEIILL